MDGDHDAWVADTLGVDPASYGDPGTSQAVAQTSAQTSAQTGGQTGAQTAGGGTTQSTTTGSATTPSGDDDPDYKAGFSDGLAGNDANPAPRDGDALDNYTRGWNEGHEALQRQTVSPTPAGPPDPNSTQMTDEQAYEQAVESESWRTAAEHLETFSEADIKEHLSHLAPDQVASLHQAALDDPGLGWNSKVARLTKTDDGPNLDDDPNTIYAGTKFRMKMLDGFTAAGEVGVGSFLFSIWDVENSRVARYEFDEVIVSAGAPISDCGEGDWSDEFETSKPLQVDQFGGTATLSEASAALVGVWRIHIAAANVNVTVPTTFNKSFGVDTGTGPFSYCSGSANVYKGG